MECPTCSRYYPQNFDKTFEKHVNLCGKFHDFVETIDYGLLICKICDNDYETQEQIFRHISQAHFKKTSKKPLIKPKKAGSAGSGRIRTTFRKNRCRFCKKNIYGVSEGTAENHEKKCPRRRTFNDAKCFFCQRFYSSGQVKDHERKCLNFLKYYQFGNTDRCQVCQIDIEDYKEHFSDVHLEVVKIEPKSEESKDFEVDDSEDLDHTVEPPSLRNSRNSDEMSESDTDEMRKSPDGLDQDHHSVPLKDKQSSTMEVKPGLQYSSENNGFLGEITEVFLCPFCDRAFLDEEFVQNHVHIVHKTTKSLVEMGVRIKTRDV